MLIAIYGSNLASATVSVGGIAGYAVLQFCDPNQCVASGHRIRPDADHGSKQRGPEHGERLCWRRGAGHLHAGFLGHGPCFRAEGQRPKPGDGRQSAAFWRCRGTVCHGPGSHDTEQRTRCRRAAAYGNRRRRRLPGVVCRRRARVMSAWIRSTARFQRERRRR